MGKWVMWSWGNNRLPVDIFKYEKQSESTVKIEFPVSVKLDFSLYLSDFEHEDVDLSTTTELINWCCENIENDVTNMDETVHFKTEDDAAFFKLRWV